MLTTYLEPPEVTDTAVEAHLLQALHRLTHLSVNVLNRHLRVLAVLPVTLQWVVKKGKDRQVSEL